MLNGGGGQGLILYTRKGGGGGGRLEGGEGVQGRDRQDMACCAPSARRSYGGVAPVSQHTASQRYSGQCRGDKAPDRGCHPLQCERSLQCP